MATAVTATAEQTRRFGVDSVGALVVGADIIGGGAVLVEVSAHGPRQISALPV
jgi:hypothetical protein